MMKRMTLSSGITLVLAALTIMMSGTASVRADVVSDWNAFAVQTTVNAYSPVGPAVRGVPTAVIDIAAVHAAIYDAVQAIEGDYDPYYVDIPGASGSPIAAAAKAAHDVLVNRFPGQAVAIGQQYNNSSRTALHRTILVWPSGRQLRRG